MRRVALLVLAVIALAFAAATLARGRAEWTPPPGPSEPGTLPGR